MPDHYPASYVAIDDDDVQHYYDAGMLDNNAIAIDDLDGIAARFSIEIDDHDFDPFAGVHTYTCKDVPVLKIETDVDDA